MRGGVPSFQRPRPGWRRAPRGSVGSSAVRDAEHLGALGDEVLRVELGGLRPSTVRVSDAASTAQCSRASTRAREGVAVAARPGLVEREPAGLAGRGAGASSRSWENSEIALVTRCRWAPAGRGQVLGGQVARRRSSGSLPRAERGEGVAGADGQGRGLGGQRRRARSTRKPASALSAAIRVVAHVGLDHHPRAPRGRRSRSAITAAKHRAGEAGHRPARSARPARASRGRRARSSGRSRQLRSWARVVGLGEERRLAVGPAQPGVVVRARRRSRRTRGRPRRRVASCICQ